MYDTQYVNQLRSIAMCGLVHKYVRKATPELIVEKLYNPQAGTVLPIERLDFYHRRQKYSGVFRGLPTVFGDMFRFRHQSCTGIQLVGLTGRMGWPWILRYPERLSFCWFVAFNTHFSTNALRRYISARNP